MSAQPLPPKKPLHARLTGALMNLSLLLGMVVLASLLGIAGAALFVFYRMGDPSKIDARVSHAPARPAKIEADPARPAVIPPGAEHSAAPVANPDEWHFAEFSAEPRYVDVTYDEGRQHARLKVNTVLSASPAAAAEPVESAPVFSPPAPGSAGGQFPLSDPGSRFITDPRTGRVVGVDGTAAAAEEARRAAAFVPHTPAPGEVRKASPVVELGRPVFGSEFRRAQVTTPVTTYLPTRRALPVAPAAGGAAPFDAQADLADPDNLPARPALPATPAPRNNPFYRR